MLRYNQSYGSYSQKYQEHAGMHAEAFNQEHRLYQSQRQQINDKTKKLCAENKKRRRQFEERQRIHERNEQKRREDALNSRRRRQQEATNAYKAALSKEINKRNRTPVSRISSASSIGSQRGRNIYRSPTVDEVLSNIRGHALGGSLRTYGETSATSRCPAPPPASYTPISSYTSPTYVKNVLSFNTRPEIKPESRDSDRRTSDIGHRMTSDNKSTLEGVNKITSGMEIRSIGANSSVISQQQQLYNHPVAKQNSKESDESEETLRDSLEADDILAEYHHRSKQPLLHHHQEKDSDPDRIRVQIDLTKFDQLEVSDCESLDEPPLDPTSDDYKPRSDKHTESYTDLSRLGLAANQKTAPIQLIQSEHVTSRASSYFGPSELQGVNGHGTLRASISDPNVSSSSNTNDTYHIHKSSSHSQLNHVSAASVESPNYSISTSEGESFIFASSPVEAVKAAASAAGGSRTSTAWSTPTDTKLPDPLNPVKKKNLKSLIKRTPSAKRKQVRWDSVSALDDETMEVDQFDISSEGEAVFTRQYSHPVRSPMTRDMSRDYDDPDIMNLQRTPTDAEINELWNKVRTTLHRNTAWDSSTAQSKANLPHRAPNTRRDVSTKNLQDSLRIYSNVVMDNDVRYKFKRSGKGPGQSGAGPNISKMTEITENGHTMLSMEEQRILQSLERLDAKLKDNGTYEPIEPKTQIVTFSSPTIEVSRPQTRNETYKRLLNRKTNGMSAKYR